MGRATASAQALLVSYGYSGELDGIWGPLTQAAYDKAPGDVQAKITTLYGLQGKVTPIEHRWVPKPQALDMVAQAAAMYGVQDLVPALNGFMDREAKRSTIAGVIHYDANSRNSGSVGLFQMQKGAWADAAKKDSTLPGYGKVYDPMTNIRAGVQYAAINAARLRRKGVPVNADTLYLAHNQGMGFFLGWKDDAGVWHPPGSTTNLAGQSAEVRQLISKYSKV